MNNLFFENQGTSTFLVYGINEGDELDSMSLGMLINNNIPGFAKTSFMQMDATKYIKYNVSSKVSAAQLFSGPVNKKRLLGVFSGIVTAMMSAEEYMIDPATILLDMDYIFSDVSTCETNLICLPVMQDGAKSADLAMFFKNIIFQTQFDQTENCDHVAQIINYLNSTPILSLIDFKAVLDKLSGAAPQQIQPVQQPVSQPVQQPAVSKPVQQPIAQPVQPKPVAAAPVQQPVQPGQAVPQQKVASAAPAGFAIPGQKPAAPTQKAAAPAAAAPEKEISFMYLMQHYSKENAAAYKAQQEAKKTQKGTASAQPKPDKKTAKKQKNVPPVPAAGFQIPGQPAPAHTVPKPAGFQVPGQNMQPPVQQPVKAPTQQPVQPPVQQPVKAPAQQPVQMPVQQPVQPVIQQAPQQPAFAMSFGETTVLGGVMGETTVLGSTAVMEPQVKPHLIRAKNNERINLDKPVYRIGKEKSYVDYFIADNTAISRSHANIITRDGEYFIVDTNSTNHTYVNGGMIQSNVETKIFHDTKIRLANEEFIFKLY